MVSDLAPSQNGRDPVTGQFLPGNRLNNPNPDLAFVKELRAAIRKRTTPKRFAETWLTLECLVAGYQRCVHPTTRKVTYVGPISPAQQTEALRLILERTLGKQAQPIDLAETLDAWTRHCKEVTTDGTREGDIVADQVDGELEVRE